MQDMEVLLKKMVAGEKVNKKILDTPSIYMALVLSYEGLQLSKEQLEVSKKIEEHLARINSAIVERHAFTTEPEKGQMVLKLRTTGI